MFTFLFETAESQSSFRTRLHSRGDFLSVSLFPLHRRFELERDCSLVSSWFSLTSFDLSCLEGRGVSLQMRFLSSNSLLRFRSSDSIFSMRSLNLSSDVWKDSNNMKVRTIILMLRKKALAFWSILSNYRYIQYFKKAISLFNALDWVCI